MARRWELYIERGPPGSSHPKLSPVSSSPSNGPEYAGFDSHTDERRNDRPGGRRTHHDSHGDFSNLRVETRTKERERVDVNGTRNQTFDRDEGVKRERSDKGDEPTPRDGIDEKDDRTLRKDERPDAVQGTNLDDLQ